HGRALDKAVQAGRRHELQVDMYQRWPVKADQQPRFPDVLAAERRQQISDPRRYFFSRRHDLAVALFLRDHDKIEVRMSIEPSVDIRTAGQQGSQPPVALHYAANPLDELPMQGWQCA